MPSRLEQLKAEHPEWCFRCGSEQPVGVNHLCGDWPILAALVEALGEEEELHIATAKLQDELIITLRAQLTASEAARTAAEGALKGTITKLLTGMRYWGSQEDGIPDECWEAYQEGCMHLHWVVDPVYRAALKGGQS